MFSFLIQKIRSFLGLVAKNLNEKFTDNASDFIEIKGAISGKLYFSQPQEGIVKFTIKKEELAEKVKEDICDNLPKTMYFA